MQAAARVRLARERDPREPWRALEGFRLNAPPSLEVSLQFNDTTLQIKLDRTAPAALPTLDAGESMIVFAGGYAYTFTDPIVTTGAGSSASSSIIHSPLPGRIVSRAGQAR